MKTYEQRHDAIIEMLKELGVPAGLLGHKYIISALHTINVKPSALYEMTRVLYPAVAKEHNTTSSRAERAIRHAVETAFTNMPPDIIQKYFGNSISFYKGKATNSQFLAALSLELENKLRS